MVKQIDIYNYDWVLVSTLQKVRDAQISDSNKNLIEKFTNFCFANGIGKPRVIKYMRTTRHHKKPRDLRISTQGCSRGVGGFLL